MRLLRFICLYVIIYIMMLSGRLPGKTVKNGLSMRLAVKYTASRKKPRKSPLLRFGGILEAIANHRRML